LTNLNKSEFFVTI